MHTSTSIPTSSKDSQHGAVLVVSLLILLVLTIIGVSSLDSSVMQEKMSSNSQTATSTFQKAETAIREAFFEESPKPAKAISKARAGASPVTRTAGGITSTSQLLLPGGNTQLYNNSAPNGDGAGFVARKLEIVGKANVGSISNTNTQGYSVFPLMQIQ